VTLYTVGHGARPIAELVAVLRAHGVERLVDVRRYPASRRHPHFGREPLAASLAAAGIAYLWRGEELGGRRSRGPEPSRHPAWRNAAFQAYADYMDTPAFREALAALETEAAAAPTAVMCAERLWWHCHRRLVADALAVRGVEVVHLLDEAKGTPHPLHESLRVDEAGRPVYDVGCTGLLGTS
jgi:uncharacterized protein (DUF488 family)